MVDLTNARELAGQLEAGATDLVARLAPWLAPAPTAFLVGRATIRHLEWPAPVGIVAALVIESLGLSTTATALMLRDYNAEKRKSDPVAPYRFAAGLVSVYLVSALGLTILLDVAPQLGVYAPAVFPLLSLCGVMVLAIRSDHRRRLEAIAKDKAKRSTARAEAAERKAAEAIEMGSGDSATDRALVKQWAEVAGQKVETSRGIPKLSGKKARMAWLAENRRAIVEQRLYPADLADIWECHLRTVERYLKELPDEEAAELSEEGDKDGNLDDQQQTALG